MPPIPTSQTHMEPIGFLVHTSLSRSLQGLLSSVSIASPIIIFSRRSLKAAQPKTLQSWPLWVAESPSHNDRYLGISLIFTSAI